MVVWKKSFGPNDYRLVQTIWSNDKGQCHSEQRSSMDEAHQAASIEPSLTKIQHNLNELAPSDQTNFVWTKQICCLFGPNKICLVQTIWSNDKVLHHQTETTMGSSSVRRFDCDPADPNRTSVWGRIHRSAELSFFRHRSAMGAIQLAFRCRVVPSGASLP